MVCKKYLFLRKKEIWKSIIKDLGVASDVKMLLNEDFYDNTKNFKFPD